MSAPDDCLIDRIGWVPVHAGDVTLEVPLRRALLEGHVLDGLAAESPTLVPAILRQVLVPVVLAALDGVTAEEWADMLALGRFTDQQAEAINRYLTEHADAFRLFDTTRPFGQAAGLEHAHGAVKPVTALTCFTASGANTPLWDIERALFPQPLRPGAAVQWMLHTQCWDTGGIKGAAVGDGQAKDGKVYGSQKGALSGMGVTVPVGRTLFDTIVLNLPLGPRAAGDKPVWEGGPAGPQWVVRRPRGVLDWLTWQGRRIRLVHQGTDGARVVTGVVLAAGDQWEGGLPEFEPHTCWVNRAVTTVPKSAKAKPKTETSRFPYRIRPGRAAWRGLDALMAVERTFASSERQTCLAYETSLLLSQAARAVLVGDLAADYPLRVVTCSMGYDPMGSIVQDVTSDSMPLPATALCADFRMRQSVVRVHGQAEALGVAVDRLADHILLALGGRPEQVKAGEDPKGQRQSSRLLHLLEPYVTRFLAGCSTAPDDEVLDRAHLAFETLVERAVLQVAEDVLHRLPGEAFNGRVVEEKRGGKDVKVVYRQVEAERFFRAAVRRQLTYLYPPTETGKGVEKELAA
ncbi:type I-E CRISPR-associated protein Cse1/CasA [Streptomyces lavendulae]|uniref:type I-E CRISPR-associated protein Cse1/CasA n=1 Tax=Streptomyces lavendulae TaxID=1914 RepID=UPI0037FA54FA